jgi:hypothetical protein
VNYGQKSSIIFPPSVERRLADFANERSLEVRLAVDPEVVVGAEVSAAELTDEAGGENDLAGLVLFDGDDGLLQSSML